MIDDDDAVVSESHFNAPKSIIHEEETPCAWAACCGLATAPSHNMRVIGVCGLCGWLADWQAGQLTGCLAGRMILLVLFNLPILMVKKGLTSLQM